VFGKDGNLPFEQQGKSVKTYRRLAGQTATTGKLTVLKQRPIVMFPQKLSEAINRQIHQELQSAYHYLAMAAHFQNEGLDGFAHWMEMQHGEEMQHAMLLFRYVHRGHP
jgi:hypothetical protein